MSKRLTLIDYLRLSAEFLANKGIESARLDAEVILCHVLGKDRVYLYVHFDQPLEPSEVDAYRDLIVRRGQRVPVAYLTGEKEFFSRTFTVTPGVLIPRPDTEILVEHVITWAKGRDEVHIADIGTGSGAIAVTLALELPHATVLATDISSDALRIAEQNARAHGVAERVRFLPGPWLAPLEGRKVDVVVSNPPYIPSKQIDTLAPEVSVHEPRLALDGGGDGLAAYRVLVPKALERVREGGLLAVEVGQGQAQAVARMAEAAGWTQADILKDHAGIDRVVSMQRGAA